MSPTRSDPQPRTPQAVAQPNPRAECLASRRAALQAQSQRLRGELAHDLHALVPWGQRVDRVRDAWRWLTQHPALVVGATVALVVARPRTAWRWGGRLWTAWTAWQRVRRWWTLGGPGTGAR